MPIRYSPSISHPLHSLPHFRSLLNLQVRHLVVQWLTLAISSSIWSFRASAFATICEAASASASLFCCFVAASASSVPPIIAACPCCLIAILNILLQSRQHPLRISTLRSIFIIPPIEPILIILLLCPYTLLLLTNSLRSLRSAKDGTTNAEYTT